MRTSLPLILLTALCCGCQGINGQMRLAPEITSSSPLPLQPSVRIEGKPFWFAHWRAERVRLNPVAYKVTATSAGNHVIASRKFQFAMSDGRAEIDADCSMSTRYITRQDTIDKLAHTIEPRYNGYTLQIIEDNPVLSCDFSGAVSGSLRMHTLRHPGLVEVAGEILFGEERWTLQSVHYYSNGGSMPYGPIGFELLREAAVLAALDSTANPTLRFAAGLEDEVQLQAATVFGALVLYRPDQLDPPTGHEHIEN